MDTRHKFLTRSLTWAEIKKHISSKHTDISIYEKALQMNSKSTLLSHEKKWKLKFKNYKPLYVQVFSSVMDSKFFYFLDFQIKKVQNLNPIQEIASEDPSHFLAHGNFSLFPPLKTKNGDPTWSFIYKTSGTCKDDISSKNVRRGPGSTKCCVKDYFRNIRNNFK